MAPAALTYETCVKRDRYGCPRLTMPKHDKCVTKVNYINQQRPILINRDLYQSKETYINKRDQYKRGLFKKFYLHRSAKKHTYTHTHTHTHTHLPTQLQSHYTHTHIADTHRPTHITLHPHPFPHACVYVYTQHSPPTPIPTCMCVCVYIRKRIHKDTVLFECCYPDNTINMSPKNKAYFKVQL